jgi:glycosyltransferase involved in cell wall biosynthesis
MVTGAKALACSVSARPLMFPLMADSDCSYLPYCVAAEALSGPLRPPAPAPRPALRIGSIGRLSFQKNHAFLLPVAERLQALGLLFNLRIIGDGALAGELVAEIRRRRLEEVVTVEAGRDDIQDILRTGLDVLALPSRWEGFPVILLESQAAALPVLCSDRIGKEINVVEGLIDRLPIGPGDIESWASALAKIAREPRALDPLRCRQQVAARFSPDAAWTLLARHYGVTPDECSSV